MRRLLLSFLVLGLLVHPALGQWTIGTSTQAEKNQDTGITFTPAGSAVTSGQIVTFSGAIAGSIYCSTQDGSTPATNLIGTACANGSLGATTTITTAVTVKVVSGKLGDTDSPVASAAYTIASSCALPFTDNFTGGTGALGSPWTTPIGSWQTGTVTQSGGAATIASGNGMATCGATTYTSLTVSAVYIAGGSGNSGPCVENSSGTGYCWLPAAAGIYWISGSSAGMVSGITCPDVALSHTISLQVSGSPGAWALVCKDVTASTSASGTDTNTFTSFLPAMLVVVGNNLESFHATTP